MDFFLPSKLIFLAFAIHSLWEIIRAHKAEFFVDLRKIRACRVASHRIVVVGSPGEFGRVGEQHGEAASPFFTPVLVSERQHKGKIWHDFQARHAYVRFML